MNFIKSLFAKSTGKKDINGKMIKSGHEVTEINSWHSVSSNLKVVYDKKRRFFGLQAFGLHDESGKFIRWMWEDQEYVIVE